MLLKINYKCNLKSNLFIVCKKTILKNRIELIKDKKFKIKTFIYYCHFEYCLPGCAFASKASEICFQIFFLNLKIHNWFWTKDKYSRLFFQKSAIFCYKTGLKLKYSKADISNKFLLCVVTFFIGASAL